MDVNLLKFSKLYNYGDCDSSTAQAMSRHTYGEQRKLKGASKFDSFWQRKILAEKYVADLLDNRVLLLVFTVCLLGSIGPMGRGVLYSNEHLGRPKGVHALKPNTQRAWDQATGPHAPSNMSGRANKAWAEANRKRMFFRHKHHSATPQA